MNLNWLTLIWPMIKWNFSMDCDINGLRVICWIFLTLEALCVQPIVFHWDEAFVAATAPIRKSAIAANKSSISN